MYKEISLAGLIVLFIMSCNSNDNNNGGFAHCLFNGKPRVKGHVESVIDSTFFLPGVDSLSKDTLFYCTETLFTGPQALLPNSHGSYLYDTNDIDFAFDIMGKFSRDRLISQYDNLVLKKIDYARHSLYNTEDDYASSATGGYYVKYKYKYDDSCNVLQFDQMNEDSSVEKIYTFQYNDEQNLIECKLYNGSNLLLKEVKYGYDKNNNEINYTIYDKTKKPDFNFSFTYQEYDAAGNWQKRVKYKNNKPVAVTVRNIKYL